MWELLWSPLLIIIKKLLVVHGPNPLVLILDGHYVLTYHGVLHDVSWSVPIVLHRCKTSIRAQISWRVINYFSLTHRSFSSITKMLLALDSVTLLFALQGSLIVTQMILGIQRLHRVLLKSLVWSEISWSDIVRHLAKATLARKIIHLAHSVWHWDAPASISLRHARLWIASLTLFRCRWVRPIKVSQVLVLGYLLLERW